VGFGQEGMGRRRGCGSGSGGFARRRQRGSGAGRRSSGSCSRRQV